MARTEAVDWGCAVAATFPGGKGWIEIRGWGDPVPEYHIQFYDGHHVFGCVKGLVVREADLYFAAVERLTGEPP
jgi:hypothetical protein